MLLTGFSEPVKIIELLTTITKILLPGPFWNGLEKTTRSFLGLTSLSGPAESGLDYL